MKWTRLFACVLLICTLLLNAVPAFAANKDMTGGDRIYYYMDSTKNSKFYNSEGVGSGGTDRIYAFYKGITSYVPYIFLFSVVLGCFLFVVCRKNKSIQRFAVFILIIGIPIVCIMFVFGLGFLLNMFLG